QEIAGKSEVDGSLELLDIDSVTIKKSSYAIHGKVITIPDDYQLVKGDRVYLSGPSGVGKSTILKLFPRFRDCDFIQINGHNLEDYSLKSLRKKVSYLAPDTAIIPLTLKSNLTLAVEFKDDNSLFNLMDSAVLKPILVNKNLDTLINEGGSNLSGGEKQRIALARELLKNTDVLLLDEATNSLDDSYSELIMKQIFEKFSNKIIILVSHNEDFRNYCQKEIKLNIATPEL
ncbi:MAG: ATP-binding cassette domain-containing protein, partial [Acholeplasmatales bacterium]|nr:ATP-binding cassette domain-containing protein [Acholeplasmatales bacterium]